MFVQGIETAGAFTRPIHTISRLWSDSTVLPGSATAFFVNADGWALTCRHVAQELAAADQVVQRYSQFKADIAALPNKNNKQAVKAVAQKYGYTGSTPVQTLFMLVNCIEGSLDLEMRLHASLDVALLRFRGFSRLHCNTGQSGRGF